MRTTVDVDTPTRVSNGAAFLDSRQPEWHAQIDLGRFSLRSDCGCVLGQMFKSYDAGVEALGLNSEVEEGDSFDIYPAAANCGFETWSGDDAEWDALDAEWRRVISQRQTAAAS